MNYFTATVLNSHHPAAHELGLTPSALGVGGELPRIRVGALQIQRLKEIASGLERAVALPAALLLARGDGTAPRASMKFNGELAALCAPDAIAVNQRAAVLAGTCFIRN